MKRSWRITIVALVAVVAMLLLVPDARAADGQTPVGQASVGQGRLDVAWHPASSQVDPVPTHRVFLPRVHTVPIFAAAPTPLHYARSGHTATSLRDGTILVAGGVNGHSVVAESEIYDPVSGQWHETGALLEPRQGHRAVVLQDGRVLVIGGDRWDDPGEYSYVQRDTAEIYDPATGAWSLTAQMACARINHTATMLRDGRVLVVGGCESMKQSAELFDPATGRWAPTEDLQHKRRLHAATRLADGRVLVVGGGFFGEDKRSAEVYDPGTGQWSQVASTQCGHDGPKAVTLASGHVLLVGGKLHESECPFAEAYDPAVDAWRAAPPLELVYIGHSLTALADGRVLLIGEGLAPSAIYDASLDRWEYVGRLHEARGGHSATPLGDGSAVVIGGGGVWIHRNTEFAWNTAGTRASVERLDTVTGNWHTASEISGERWLAAAVSLDDGDALVTGGYGVGGAMRVADLVDGATGKVRRVAPMQHARADHTATLLDDGRVLVTGGVGGFGSTLDSAEVYDPDRDEWMAVGKMNGPRYRHSATLLLDGNVLLAGGGVQYGLFESVRGLEVFDSASGAFQPVAGPSLFAMHHSATRLISGDVLLAQSRSTIVNHQYLTWREIGGFGDRISHASSLLPDGRVVVTGGIRRIRTGSMYVVETAAAFHPETEAWSHVAAPRYGRQHHASSLLSDGSVLITGGCGARSHGTHTDEKFAATAELYEPASDTWQLVASMATARSAHSTVVLPDGRALVAGGFNQAHDPVLAHIEIYDPATNSWTLGDAFEPDIR